MIIKKINDNRFLVTTFAVFSLIFTPIVRPITKRIVRPITKRIHKRDVMSFALGMLVMIVSVRYMDSKDVAPVVEAPVETPEIVQEIIPRVIEVPEINEDAANIARVLNGVSAYHLSDNAKTAIIETILSRVECSYGEFGDTIEEVCLKPQQWQGFVEGSSYLREDYQLALDYLNDTSGARVTPEGCYWFTVSDDGVTVRTKFDGGNAWTIN